MNRRALVIRRFGDDEIARTIEGAIIHNSFSAELEALRGELMAMKSRDAYQGIHTIGCRKSWREKLNELPVKYGFPEEQYKPNRVAAGILVGWATMWYGIFMAYDRLSAWNRGGYAK